jgi:hypothetical protein
VDTNLFKRNVAKTLAPKPAKEGIRKIARKTAATITAQAVVGLKVSTGELHRALEAYLLGFQLTDALRLHARENLGDVLYQLAVLSKILKVKLPGSRKKVYLKGMTMTQAVLRLDQVATDMLGLYLSTFKGQDLAMTEIKKKFEDLPLLVYQIVGTMLNVPVGVVMDTEIEKLEEQYPAGLFAAPAPRQPEAGAPASEAATPKAKAVPQKGKTVAKKPGVKIVKKPVTAQKSV